MKTIAKVLILSIVVFFAGSLHGADVVYQAWATADTPLGSHWTNVTSMLSNIKASGYGAIWLPFPVRCVSNNIINGECPYDFYDLGGTAGDGWIPTALGNKDQLLNLVNTAHSNGLKVYFSINVNHMGKGLITQNPNVYPNFDSNDFHYNGTISDIVGSGGHSNWELENGAVNGCDDLAHEKAKVRQFFLTWIKWFVSETQADQLVIEYAKNMPYSFVKDLAEQSGIPCVANLTLLEGTKLNTYYSGNMDVSDYVLQDEIFRAFATNSRFGFVYLDQNTMYQDASLNFIANHYVLKPDLDDLALVYLLLKDGVPSLYNPGIDNIHIQNLLYLRKRFATGPMRYRYLSKDTMIFEREGSLLVGINKSSEPKSILVNTEFYNTTLSAQAGSGSDIEVGKDGKLRIVIPANSWIAYASPSVYLPTVSFTYPVNGAYVTENPCIIKMSTTGKIRKVEVRIDGQRWKRALSREDGYEYRWYGFSSGSHRIEARSIDEKGNISDINQIVVTCASDPLKNTYTLRLTVPILRHKQKISTYVNTHYVPLSIGTYIDLEDKRQYTIDVSQYILETQTGTISFVDPGRDNAFTVENVALLENGVVIEEWPGSFDPDRTGKSFAYDLNRVRPNVEITYPLEGMIWTSTNLRIRITTEDIQDTVFVVVNGKSELSCIYKDGHFETDVPNMTNGAYTLRAIAMDKDGNRASSAERNFTCDVTALLDKYILSWEGFDWDISDEIFIEINGHQIAWSNQHTGITRNCWANFSLDVTDQVSAFDKGYIKIWDNYGFYRNYIRNVVLTGPDVKKGSWQKEEVDVPFGGLTYQYQREKENAKITGLTVSPNPFSPNGDGRRETTIISFTVKNGRPSYILEIKDSNGNLKKSYTGKVKDGNHVSVVWDGKDISDNLCADGHYTVKATLLGVKQDKKSTATTLVELDTTPPVAVTAIKVIQTTTNLRMFWSIANQPDSAKYKVVRDPVFKEKPFREVNHSDNPTFFDPDIIWGKGYKYTVIPFDKAENEGAPATYNVEYWTTDEIVKKKERTIINFMDMQLIFPAGSVESDTTITLSEDTNVHRVAHVKLAGRVFNLEPDGLYFKKPVEVRMKYVEERIPRGFDEKHIYAYTWSKVKKPVNLFRASIDTNENQLICKMYHFSSVGTGVLDLPSNPQAGGGVKTDLSKLATANPLAGKNIINAPTVNSSGDCVMQYPIPVPEGPAGSKPQIVISYSSGAGNGYCGVGWNLQVGGAILRVNNRKRGAVCGDDNDKFLFNGQEIVAIDDNKFKPKYHSQGNVLLTKFNNRNGLYWIAKTSTGSEMVFGNVSRNGDYHINSTGYESGNNWVISQSKDVFGNTINYSYEKDNNTFYVKEISYHNDNRRVLFDWETRSDKSLSYALGVKQLSTKRLKRIKLYYKPGNLIHEQYVLNYDDSDRLSYLDSIEHWRNGLKINTTTFQYEPKQVNYGGFALSVTNWPAPYSSGGSHFVTFSWFNETSKVTHTEVAMRDFNGDGLVDWVRRHRDGESSPGNERTIRVSYNSNGSFSDRLYRKVATDWHVHGLWFDDDVSSVAQFGNASDTRIDWYDLNGDGFQDRVAKIRGNSPWCVNYNRNGKFEDNVQTFGYGAVLPVPEQVLGFAYSSYSEVGLYDMNGDGLTDYVHKNIDSAHFHISFNDGEGFNNKEEWRVNIKGGLTSNFVGNTYVDKRMIDVNGDGLPDWVHSIDYSSRPHSYYIQILFNNGSGFEAPVDWLVPSVFSKEVNIVGQVYTYFIPLSYESTDGEDKHFKHTRIDMVDINGDGLPDFIQKNPEEPYFTVSLNNGHNGFDTPVDWPCPLLDVHPVYGRGSIRYSNNRDNYFMQEISFLDVTGDGLPDRIMKHKNNDFFSINRNNSKPRRKLEKVFNGVNGEYHISYTRTANTIQLPFQKSVVEKIEAHDQVLDFSLATRYKFWGGCYNRQERQFVGFGCMAVTNGEGASTITYYHTNNVDLAGRAYKVVSRARNNNIVGVKETQWQTHLLDQDNGIIAVLPKVGISKKFLGNSNSEDNPVLVSTTISYYQSQGQNGIYPIGSKTSVEDTHNSVTRTSYKTNEYTTLTVNGVTGYFPTVAKEYVGDTLVSHKTISYNTSKGIMTNQQYKNLATGSWITEKHIEYNANGTVSYTIDSRGNKVEYQYYSDLGIYPQYETMTTASGQEYQTEFTYSDDAFKGILSKTDPYGNTISYQYNDKKQVSKIFWNSTKLTEMEYGVTTDPVYYVKTTTYFETNRGIDKYIYVDGFGKTVQEKEYVYVNGADEYLSTGKFERDGVGRVTRQGSPFIESGYEFSIKSSSDWGLESRKIYDDLGRVESVMMGSDVVATTVYSFNGGMFETTVTTLNNSSKRTKKNVFGETRFVIDNYGASDAEVTVEYKYNDLGQLVNVIEEDGAATSITYDVSGRKIEMTTPDTGTYKYGYNKYGQMTGQTNALGQVTKYFFDDDGRLDYVQYHNGQQTDFVYGTTGNSKGRLLKLNGIGYTNTYGYNSLGSISQETRILDGKSYTTTYSYTLAGQAKTITYPDSETITYTYDIGGNLQKITSPARTYVQDIKYNQDGRRTSIEYGNDVRTEYSYDNKKQIDTIITKNSSDQTVQSLNYTFQNDGNIQSIQDLVTGGTTTYQYDKLNRMTNAHSTGHTLSTNMNYDKYIGFNDNGVISSKTGIGQYTYKIGTHRIMTAGNYGFRYDMNGNMTNRFYTNTTPGMTEIYRSDYHFNDQNVMTYVTNSHEYNGGSRWVRFMYDHTGQRLKKWSSENNNFRYINGYYTLKYYNGDKTCTNKHIYAGKERVCTVVDNEPAFIHRDHLNSGGVVSTNGGGVGDRVAFAPYGEVLYQQNNNSRIDEKFTGQLLDPETGLYYFNARYYDPKVGVFISSDSIIPDPHDSQSLNRYMYVNGNPIKYTDPTGHFAFSTILPGIGPILDSACWGAVLGGASYTASVAINEDKWKIGQFAVAMGFGIINGAISGGIAQGLKALGASTVGFGGMAFWSPTVSINERGLSIGIGGSLSGQMADGLYQAGIHMGLDLNIMWDGSGTSLTWKQGIEASFGWRAGDSNWRLAGAGVNLYASTANGVPGQTTASLFAFRGTSLSKDGKSINTLFGIQSENDYFLYHKGDSDRYRTAAGSLTVGPFSVGFSLITGDLREATPSDPADFYEYQQGALYFGYRNLRVGSDSQRTRQTLQNWIHREFDAGAFWMTTTDNNYYSWAIGGDPYWYY